MNIEYRCHNGQTLTLDGDYILARHGDVQDAVSVPGRRFMPFVKVIIELVLKNDPVLESLEWYPMDTAPMDNNIILIKTKTGIYDVVYYDLESRFQIWYGVKADYLTNVDLFSAWGCLGIIDE